MRLLLGACLAVVICLGSFGESANAQQNFSATQAILSSGLHLFAPVSINGTKRTWWLIDTGAPGSLIAPSLQKRLSLPAPPPQARSEVKISGKNYPVVLAQSVDFNGAQIGPGYMAVAPLAVMAKEKATALSCSLANAGPIWVNLFLQPGAVLKSQT